MSTPRSRALVQVYDGDRRKGRCCCSLAAVDAMATGM